MANNRYYLYCDCGEVQFLGKSLGRGIFTTPAGSFTLKKHEGLSILQPDKGNQSQDDADISLLNSVFDWMWKHLMECPKPNAKIKDTLGPEWADGEIFKVLTEGDERVLRTFHRKRCQDALC